MDIEAKFKDDILTVKPFIGLKNNHQVGWREKKIGREVERERKKGNETGEYNAKEWYWKRKIKALDTNQGLEYDLDYRLL